MKSISEVVAIVELLLATYSAQELELARYRVVLSTSPSEDEFYMALAAWCSGGYAEAIYGSVLNMVIDRWDYITHSFHVMKSNAAKGAAP